MHNKTEFSTNQKLLIMTNEILFTLEWIIKPGGLNALKVIANKVIKMVQDNELDMKGIFWAIKRFNSLEKYKKIRSNNL